PHEIAAVSSSVRPRAGHPTTLASRGPRCGDPAWPWIPAGVHPRESGGGNERRLSGGRSLSLKKRGPTRTARNVAPVPLFCYFVKTRGELRLSFSSGPVSH